ncbi:hypothetical protein SDC9_152134 [bioreactor metagenome]|uniref:Uncharacterized protein n=1 Tax=bioreactor metagenome TaxID=1076179 RepID=A0A645ETY2_9ZZZZ
MKFTIKIKYQYFLLLFPISVPSVGICLMINFTTHQKKALAIKTILTLIFVAFIFFTILPNIVMELLFNIPNYTESIFYTIYLKAIDVLISLYLIGMQRKTIKL